MGSISIDPTFNYNFFSLWIREDLRTGKQIYFTPEVEDEVIRDAVSHKLYIPLVNSSNKVCRYSIQTKNPTSTFQICGSIGDTNEGHNYMV